MDFPVITRTMDGEMLSLESNVEKLYALVQQIAQDGKLTQIVALESEAPMGSDVLMRQYYTTGGSKDYKVALESIAGQIASLVLKALGFLLEMIGKFIKWVANFFRGKKTLTEEVMDEAKQGAEKAKEKIRDALRTAQDAIKDTIKKQNLAVHFSRQMKPAYWDIFNEGAYTTLMKRTVNKIVQDKDLTNLSHFAQDLAKWYTKALEKADAKDQIHEKYPTATSEDDLERKLAKDAYYLQGKPRADGEWVHKDAAENTGMLESIKTAIQDLSHSNTQILEDDIQKCIDRAVKIMESSKYTEAMKILSKLGEEMSSFQKSVEAWEKDFVKSEQATRDDKTGLFKQVVKKQMVKEINGLTRSIATFFQLFNTVMQFYREVTATSIILLDYATTAVEATAKEEGERYPKLKEQADELKAIRDDIKKKASKF